MTQAEFPEANIFAAFMERNSRTRDNNSGRLKSRLEPGLYEDRRVRSNTDGRPQNEERPLKRRANSPVETHAKESKKADSATEEPKDSHNYYELSPLMTAMLEDELKDLMINVWKNLPDDASKEAEKFVLEKFKDTAGDDLRQTIGLNVTKRLLNVNNVLRVKLIIPGVVLSSELAEFGKQHRIIDLELVNKPIYVGRVDNWADYDKLMTAKNLTCGDSKVTASPVYRFLHCPPNLRTVFDGKHDFSHDKALEREAARQMKQAKESLKVLATADKVLAEEAKKQANKDSTNATKAEIKVGKAVSAKPANKQLPNNKEFSEQHEKAESARPAAAISSQTKTTEENQSLPTKSDVNKKQTSIKTPIKPKPNSNPKGAVNPKINDKPIEVKSVKQEPPKVNKTPINKVAPKINATKTLTIPKVAKSLENKPVLSSKAFMKKAKPKKNDDFDELDDHDILAMLSGGIVLDECSGSDID